MANYQEFMQRADEMALSLTRNSQNGTAFLTSVARLYKYPYNEQLMIYSQRVPLRRLVPSLIFGISA